MNPAGWAAVIVAASGLITAITALISAIKAHGRITAGQQQNSAAGGSSASASSGH